MQRGFMGYEGYDAQQLGHRSRQDSLAWDLVKVGLRTIQARLRVLSDKKLIESLSTEQQEAMYLIAAAYHSITNGIGMKTCTWLLLPSSGAGDIHRGAALQADYFRWHTKCKDMRLNPQQALDVIAFGFSLREVDRNNKQGRGKARINLVNCLDLWRV